MFEKNDLVVYGIQGVCRIEGTVNRTLDGSPVAYYAMTPVYSPASTIYVPVGNPELTARMKPILSAEELHAIIRELPELPSLWIPEENRRKQHYRELLLRGDRRELGALIGTLYRHRQAQQARGKKLHISDERCLKDAERMLYSEFAVILHKLPEEIPAYIHGLLHP